VSEGVEVTYANEIAQLLFDAYNKVNSLNYSFDINTLFRYSDTQYEETFGTYMIKISELSSDEKVITPPKDEELFKGILLMEKRM
jgi:hypothetical protein